MQGRSDGAKGRPKVAARGITRPLGNSGIEHAMLLVSVEFVEVLFKQGLVVADDQQVFGVAGLGGIREIETASDDNAIVNEDNLIVSDRVFRVYQDRNTLVGQERGGRIFGGFIALVQHGFDYHAALLRVHYRLGDWFRREAICLNANAGLRRVQCLYNRIRASAGRRKVNLYGLPIDREGKSG